MTMHKDMVQGTVPDEAKQSLPMPEQIKEYDEEDLAELVEYLFDLLPNPKETLGDYSHDMGTVTALLEPYISTHLGKDHVKPLLQCVDPDNYNLALAKNFQTALLFILRLVQYHHHKSIKQQERMKQLEKMSFLALCATGDECEKLESPMPSADKNGKSGSFPSSADPPSSKIKARRSSSMSPSSLSPKSPPRRVNSRRASFIASDPNGISDKSKLSRRPSFMSADPGSVTEIAKLRASSLSRQSSSSNLSLSTKVLTYEQLLGVKSIFKDADLNGDGSVTWEELRAHAPGLPEDPDVIMGPDAEGGVSISFLIRVLYPGVSPEQAQQYEEDLNKTFVLPEDKRQEIADLFCHAGGITKRESMEPLKLYHWLRQSLQLDHTESAKAYWHMLVAADLKSSPPANKGKVTLQQFTDWYAGNILTEKFKYDNLK